MAKTDRLGPGKAMPSEKEFCFKIVPGREEIKLKVEFR
jgi:hypothetical protein